MGTIKILIFAVCVAAFCGCTKLTTEFNSTASSFQRAYGTDYEDEEAVTIIEAYGGGYIAVGINEATPDSTSDICLMHLAEDGSLIENYIYGGFNYDDAHSIIHTADGGYMLAGRSMSFTGTFSDLLIIKLAADLSVQWSKAFSGYTNDRALSVKQLNDGGYIVAGATGSAGAGNFDWLIMRLSGSGDVQWARTIGGTGFDLAHSISVTPEGNFLAAGWITMPGSMQDICAVKLSGDGNIIWQKSYGGARDDLAFSMEPVSYGRYAIAGFTESYGAGSSDAFLLNINGDGDVNWFRTYGGGLRDEVRSVKRTFDGGYVMSGFTFSSGVGEGDGLFIKLSGAGGVQAANTFGGKFFDVVYSVLSTSDGGYIMPGSLILPQYGKTDASIVKTSGTGENCGSRSFPSLVEGSYNISAGNTSFTAGSFQPVILNPVIIRNTFPAIESDPCAR